MEKRNSEIIKIAIVGPESTGKSTLAFSLAQSFNTLWVPEFAREYLQSKNGIYNYNDLEYIAKMQIQLEEDRMLQANTFLFCDTNLIVLKIWSNFVFGKCCNFILEHIQQRNYHLTLLTNIDIPWEEDPLREHPNNREELFLLYKNELDKQNIVYSIISGSHEERLKSATQVINDLTK